MLAKTPILSAEALGLFEKQRTALIETLDYMESGAINETDFNVDGLKFRMRAWIHRYECGTDPYKCNTACCMGGTAVMLSKDRFLFDKYPSGWSSAPEALENLFFEWSNGSNNDVSVERAASQLRQYLTTGECPINWADQV